MIAANDGDISFLTSLTADQLRQLIAHSAGLLSHECGEESAARTLYRVADRLLSPSANTGSWFSPKGNVSKDALATVLNQVSALTDIPPDVIMSASKRRPIAHARMLAMYLLREMKRDNGIPHYSYPAIGRAFGKDHTTAMHACRKIRVERLQQRSEAA